MKIDTCILLGAAAAAGGGGGAGCDGGQFEHCKHAELGLQKYEVL